MSCRSNYVFAAGALAAAIFGMAPDATAWVRTLPSTGCKASGSPVSEYDCPVVSDSNEYGGSAQAIYADVSFLGGSTVTVCAMACAEAFDGGHIACGSTARAQVAPGHQEISVPIWGAASWIYPEWTYYEVQVFWCAGESSWGLNGISVSSTPKS